MAALTPEQRIVLELMRRKLGDDRSVMAAGRLFADNLRAQLPGMPDVDIGLVLVHAGAHAIGAAKMAAAMEHRDSSDGQAALHSLAAIFGAAALDLTDLHTREETP